MKPCWPSSPRNADYRRLLANTYQNDGDYRAVLPNIDGALQSFRRKLSLDEQSLAEDPLQCGRPLGYRIYIQQGLGDLLAQSGSHTQALSSLPEGFGRALKSWVAESTEDLFRPLSCHASCAAASARCRRISASSPAALTEYSRVIALLDGIAADPTSGTHSSLRGQVYMRVAAIHAALGASPKLGAAEKREHWRTARDLYARSLEVWQDMVKRKILTA